MREILHPAMPASILLAVSIDRNRGLCLIGHSPIPAL
jgi:hypothetical protein